MYTFFSRRRIRSRHKLPSSSYPSHGNNFFCNLALSQKNENIPSSPTGCNRIIPSAVSLPVHFSKLSEYVSYIESKTKIIIIKQKTKKNNGVQVFIYSLTHGVPVSRGRCLRAGLYRMIREHRTEWSIASRAVAVL